MKALVGTGIRVFLNLMEEDETNYSGQPFVPYQDVAASLCPEIACIGHSIRDLTTPSTAQDWGPMCYPPLDAVHGPVLGGGGTPPSPR